MRASTIRLPAARQAKKHAGMYPGAGFALAAAALIVQGFLPMRPTPFSQVSLPLIVVVFLAISGRSSGAGMLAGMGIGWAQDALTHGPLGVFGIVQTCVGYAASSIGLYVNVGYPGIRSTILALSFLLHQALLLTIRNGLLGGDVSFDPLGWTAWAAVHAVVGLLLYPLFDKLKRAQ